MIKYETCLFAGQFDIIHPGYLNAFEYAKIIANTLVIYLDDSERKRPIFSVKERCRALKALKVFNIQTDLIVTYKTEDELYSHLKQLQIEGFVRLLGSDYINRFFTGKDLNIPVVYRDRTGEWSYSKIRETFLKSAGLS